VPPNAKRWYVAEAYDGEDEQAYLRLAAAFSPAGINVWRPIDATRATIRQRGKLTPLRRERRRPRFGRFIFIHCEMTDALLHAIRNTTNIRDVLRYAGSYEPVPVPDAQVEFARDNAPIKPKALPVGMAVGAVARVEDGPFIGLLGQVTALDERGVVTVELPILGRPTPIPFEVGHVSVAVVQAPPPNSRTSHKEAAKSASSAKLCQQSKTKVA
jgi:transcription antitermination factor NusG